MSVLVWICASFCSVLGREIKSERCGDHPSLVTIIEKGGCVSSDMIAAASCVIRSIGSGADLWSWALM